MKLHWSPRSPYVRKVMIVAQLFNLVVSLALASCAWLGLVGPWTLLLFTFAIGVGALSVVSGWMSPAIDVPPGVPSELHGSQPASTVQASNHVRPLTCVDVARRPGWTDVPIPGAMSRMRRVPAGVPSVRQGSRPEMPSSPQKNT